VRVTPEYATLASAVEPLTTVSTTIYVVMLMYNVYICWALLKPVC